MDEAHSSQPGEMTKSLKQVFTASSRGPQQNVSTFAFTATPNEKTLELFGHRAERGRYAPFSLYSIRQAIEEGFILDVLQNYTTYQTYETAQDDPTYERDEWTVSEIR